MAKPVEVEAKFALPDRRLARRLKLVKQLAGFALGAKRVERVVDTYLDTKSRALHAAGYACRFRQQDDGQILVTVKQLTQPDQAIHRREEHEVILPHVPGGRAPLTQSAWPESPARDLVQRLAGKKRLARLFTLRQQRTVRLLLRDGQTVAELSLDDVRIRRGKTVTAFSEVEVELKPAGDEAALETIAVCLRDKWGLAPEPRSKFERALALVEGREPASAATPQPAGDQGPGIGPDDSMAEAARKTLLFHFGRMIEHEAGTRLGEDIEELHDMRVATRRMRAAWRVFKPHLQATDYQPFVKALRRTGRTLGAVRDLDVIREKTGHYLDSLPVERRAELEALLAAWQARYEQSRGEMLAYLDSEAYASFKEEFGAFLQTPGAGAAPVFNEDGEALPHLVRHVLPGALFERYAAAIAYDEGLRGGDAPLERYHLLRIASKGLRYTLEFFREILPPEADDLIKRVKRLQEHLGNLQDAVVTCGILRDFLTWGTWGHEGSGKRKAALVIVAPGVAAYLSVRQTEVQELVASFPDVWAQVSGPEFKASLLPIVSNL